MNIDIKEIQIQKQIIKSIPINWNIHAFNIQNIALKFEPNFKIDSNNKDILKYMLQYFTGHKYFKDSLSKGLLLIGGVGSGKSLLFRIFEYYTRFVLQKNSFQNHNSTSIIDNVNITGVEYLSQFSDNTENPNVIYIDDVGSRNETIKHFGSEINVIEQLLSLRYNVFIRHRKITHLSTNLTINDLKNKYDSRVFDRLKEMFNIVILDNKSYRK